MHYTPSKYVEGSYSASDFRGAYTNEVYSHDYLTVLDSYSGSSYSGSSVSTYTRRYIASSHSYSESSFSQYSESHDGNPTITTYSSTGVKVFKFSAGSVSGGSKGSLTLSSSTFTSTASITYQPGWYDSSGLKNIGGIPYIPKAAIHTGYLKIGSTTFDGDNGQRTGTYTPGSAGSVSGGGGSITITPASYSKESHSYSASQFREPTVAELNAGNYVTILSGYTASSYTKESLSTRAMKYVPSQYTAPTYVGSEFRLARVSEINTLDYVSVVNSYTQSSYSEETETKTFLVS